jgi:hypothetical protein
MRQRARSRCLAAIRCPARRLLLVIFGITHQSIKVAWVEPLVLPFEDPVVMPVVWT